MVKQPTIENKTSHTPTIILLVLNLIAILAVLGHVVYHIPGSTNAAAPTAAPAVAKSLESNGVGTIGLDNTNRVQFDLIELAGEGQQPEVLQTVTVTQQDFLNSLERFQTFVKKLEDEDLIRRNDE
jgi:hypothetical protein